MNPIEDIDMTPIERANAPGYRPYRPAPKREGKFRF